MAAREDRAAAREICTQYIRDHYTWWSKFSTRGSTSPRGGTSSGVLPRTVHPPFSSRPQNARSFAVVSSLVSFLFNPQRGPRAARGRGAAGPWALWRGARGVVALTARRAQTHRASDVKQLRDPGSAPQRALAPFAVPAAPGTSPALRIHAARRRPFPGEPLGAWRLCQKARATARVGEERGAAHCQNARHLPRHRLCARVSALAVPAHRCVGGCAMAAEWRPLLRSPETPHPPLLQRTETCRATTCCSPTVLDMCS